MHRSGRSLNGGLGPRRSQADFEVRVLVQEFDRCRTGGDLLGVFGVRRAAARQAESNVREHRNPSQCLRPEGC